MSRNRHPRTFLLALGLIVGLVGTAHAGRKTILVGSHQHFNGGFGPIINVGANPTTNLDPACTLGSNIPALDNFDDIEIDQGQDAFYTLIDPALCGACGPDGQIQIDQAHVSLWFPATCTQPNNSPRSG